MDASLIREARERIGESQAAFAERFGVDQSTVHRWETNGPPARGPARRLIERELQAIADERSAGGEVSSS
ncbi:helix-turn-helix domain-containing protein [Bradyrhizobium sp. SZCCHNRI2049]|uniref:helix-turn-helix domain-containing protein n=1 Tax=Bradyrhizobium sp. SZCCHNRI2049 TaxID=3057287 RepID=UPI002916BC55|nr:helix-turn-helix domain-containing protein [Bradyrhizobium sp. SZCCHNRI2049]